jgi:hypothetical protein
MPASSGINLTALNATNLGSGTVPTARLGTGTASSSVFLAGDSTWIAAGGGITEVDSWRVTTALQMSSGDQDITANWERDDTDFTALGSGMTESSGIFSFPSTGYWLINCQVGNNKSDAYDYVGKYIKATVNNSSYAKVSAATGGSDNGAGAYSGNSLSYIFDVTNTTNCKIKLMLEGSEADIYLIASSLWTWTGFNFIKLAET